MNNVKIRKKYNTAIIRNKCIQINMYITNVVNTCMALNNKYYTTIYLFIVQLSIAIFCIHYRNIQELSIVK